MDIFLLVGIIPTITTLGELLGPRIRARDIWAHIQIFPRIRYIYCSDVFVVASRSFVLHLFFFDIARNCS